MRISTSQMQQYALNSMLNRQSDLSRTQQQIALGVKFLSPADDPPAAVAALETTRVIETIAQYQRNIDRAGYLLDLEERTLGSVQEQLQRLRELALTAGSGAGGATGRAAVAREVRQIGELVLDYANTRDVDGDYLFGGYQNQTQPYTNAGGGVFTYSGDQGQRQIQISPSTNIVAADPGSDVFSAIPAAGGGFTDILAIIDDFAVDLEANTYNVSTVTDLDSALSRIVGTRAVVGARQVTLEGVRDLNEMYSVDTQKVLSDIRDLDYTEAVSRLNLQLVGLQAAQESFSRIQNLSLFNYLR